MNKSQSYISIFVLFFILTLVFYSCAKEKEYGTPVTPEEVESLKKEGIEPDALPCDIKIIETWEFHHYEPKAGKTVGIWAANKYINDTNKFNQHIIVIFVLWVEIGRVIELIMVKFGSFN